MKMGQFLKVLDKKMIWILFYYNSLPDMPKGCRLFLKPEIMHRDFFKCNPSNTGHYEYPKFETRSYDTGCHHKEVVKFLLRKESEKYVVFYTRHSTLLDERKNKVVGYFKVDEIFGKPPKGFLAKESVLLPKDKCIEIDYNKRGVPVSWGDTSVKKTIDKILPKLIANKADDISDKYINETKRIMKLFVVSKGKRKVADPCQALDCRVVGKCYWRNKSKKNKEEMLKLYLAERKC